MATSGYQVGDEVEIIYSRKGNPEELTVAATILELARPCRFRYADHLVAELENGGVFSFDEGDDLASPEAIELWSVVKVDEI